MIFKQLTRCEKTGYQASIERGSSTDMPSVKGNCVGGLGTRLSIKPNQGSDDCHDLAHRTGARLDGSSKDMKPYFRFKVAGVVHCRMGRLKKKKKKKSSPSIADPIILTAS